MIFLRSIERQSGEREGYTGFPFPIAPLLSLRRLDFTAPVTFFVGENGTGRSTLLEAIALRARLPSAAGQPLEHDPSLAAVHPLARSLRLGWRLRTHYGFFLRVDDFFDFIRASRIREQPGENPSPPPSSSAPPHRGYSPPQQPGTTQSFRQEFGASTERGNFLNFVRKFSTPGGLHLIDEPEAALSPQGQVDLLAHLATLVADNAQFIIATHSPLLLAFPGAQILSFDGADIKPVAYDDLPHVKLTRSFLKDPDAYLHKH